MTNTAQAIEETQIKPTNVLTGISNNNQNELIELTIDPIANNPPQSPVAPAPPASADSEPVSQASNMAATTTIPVTSQPLANRTLAKDVPVFNSPHNPIRIQNVFSIRPTADKLRTTSLSSNTINEILNNNQINRDHTLATVTPIRAPIDQSRLTFPMLPVHQSTQAIPIIRPNQIIISPPHMIRMNELKSGNQAMATLIQKPAQIPIGIARPQTVRNILPKPSPTASTTASLTPNRVFIQTTNARLISAAKPSSPSKFNPTMATIQPIKNATITISSAAASTTLTSTTSTAANTMPTSNGTGKPRIVLVRNHDGKVIYKRADTGLARNVVITGSITNNKFVTNPVRISTSAASNPQIATILNKGAIHPIQKSLKGVQETKLKVANVESINKRPVPQMLKIIEQRRPAMKTYAPAASSTAASSTSVHKIPPVSTSSTLSNIDMVKQKVTTAVTAGIEKTKIPIGLTVRTLPKEAKPSNATVVNVRQASEPIEIIDLSDDDDVSNTPSPLNQSESAIQTIKSGKTNDSHIAKNAATRKSMNTVTTSNSVSSANSANAADTVVISKTNEEAPKAKLTGVITSGFLICDNLALGKLLSRKLDDQYIVVQIPGLKSSCKFPMKIKDDLTPVNNYLDKYVSTLHSPIRSTAHLIFYI